MNSLAIAIATDAGALLRKYADKKVKVHFKNNDPQNFLTAADMEVDRFIRERLAKAFPGDTILSEENASRPSCSQGRVWIVDPLDGTKDFVHGSTGFSVVIGLCVDAIPTFGIVYAPLRGELYFAEKGKGAFVIIYQKKTALQVSSVSTLEQSRTLVRNSYQKNRPLDTVLEALPAKERFHEGSTALKICLIASGKAEVLLNTSHWASKWDTCAAQVILEEAGGKITLLDGKPLPYAQESVAWKDSFVASNGILHSKLIQKIKEIRQKERV